MFPSSPDLALDLPALTIFPDDLPSAREFMIGARSWSTPVALKANSPLECGEPTIDIAKRDCTRPTRNFARRGTRQGFHRG
jgi:hypothetical protein